MAKRRRRIKALQDEEKLIEKEVSKMWLLYGSKMVTTECKMSHRIMVVYDILISDAAIPSSNLPLYASRI